MKKFGYLGCTVFLVVIIGGIIAIFASGVMRIFGFTYDQPRDALLFFLIAGLAQWPLDILVDGLITAFFQLKISTPKGRKILHFALEFPLTCLVLSLTDYFMTTIQASPLSIIIGAILLSLMGLPNEAEEA